MKPVYLIAPIAAVGALVYRMVYRRMVYRRPPMGDVAEDGLAVILTEQWGAAFRLAPNERLRSFWRGQLYEGPAIAEYHNTLDEPVAARLTEPAAAAPGETVHYRKVQIHLALTTHDRLVVGRSAQRSVDNQEVTPHSEWVPGSEVYFAYDLELAPGRPARMENGYRGRTYFCLLGTTPGARLPIWIPEEAAAAISAWRVPLQT